MEGRRRRGEDRGGKRLSGRGSLSVKHPSPVLRPSGYTPQTGTYVLQGVQVPRPLRVLIARHGETEWNLSRRFQGHLDSPLTKRGREQAQRLATRLTAESIAAVYSSDLGRALQTATPVAAGLGLEVLTSPFLREIDCGAWTGRFKDDLAREDPQAI